MTNDFASAVQTLTSAAREASANGLPDEAFNAWTGVTRTHAYGSADHAAAALALEQAVLAAGDLPSAKQRYDLLYYQAELEIGRGETDAGLIDSLEAYRIAPGEDDRFYAMPDISDALRHFADGCDYRPLIDARSGEGFDVVLLRGGIVRNLTDQGNDRGGQPSLTADGRAVLYISQEP